MVKRTLEGCQIRIFLCALIVVFSASMEPARAGIVASWHFEEGPAGSPASVPGTILDSSGNALNGTAFGGPLYIVDSGSVPGSTLGLAFNGTNSRIFVPDSAPLQLTHSLTLDAYIRIDGAVSGCCGEGQIVFRGDDRAGYDPYSLTLLSTGQLLFLIENASNQSAMLVSPFALPTGVFLRVTGSLDDTTGLMRLFVNGVLAAAQTTSIRPFAALLPSYNPGVGIGSTQGTAAPEYFNGVIDEVNIRDDADFGTLNPSIDAGGIAPLYSSVSTIQPGEWISIYGSNLANTITQWNGDFLITLNGTSVTINGKSAYLWYVSPGQINLQAPDDTATGVVPVVVTTSNGSATSTVTLAPFAPSFLLLDSKHVTGIILRSDGSGAYAGGTYDIIGPTGTSLGYATVAAKAGDSVVLFGVGFGPTSPVVLAGKAYSGAAPTTSPVNLFINNASVTPTFAGLSSAGLCQINLKLPPGLGTGDVPLVAMVGGVQTPSTVVISVQ